MDQGELRIGRMFMAGFDGLEVDSDHPVARAIRRDHIGGVILFDRNVDGSRQNISSPAQLRNLTATLQDLGRGELLIAVDQEGGRVRRLREEDGFPATVTAAWLGKQDDCKTSDRYAARMALVLAECGINMNLAPVVDLDLNLDNPIISRYERSFGKTTGQVTAQAEIFIEAHHRHSIACCLKHFPGHGSGAADSHLGFVDITQQWQPEELEPYRALIESGFGDAVMSAHVVNRRLDPAGLPATLSRPMLDGMLRRELGFGGVIVSDDLQMKAITDRWSYEEAVQRAVMAGIDLLVIGNNLVRDDEAVARGIRAVGELLNQGRISREQILASIARIDILHRKTAGDEPWSSSQPTT